LRLPICDLSQFGSFTIANCKSKIANLFVFTDEVGVQMVLNVEDGNFPQFS